MPTDAIITLERLRCIREDDGTGHSEPYIWPALLVIDNNSFKPNGDVVVGIAAPALGNARIVIKNDMRAGQDADIPTAVGRLRHRFEDGLTTGRLILIVILWEEDETPEAAMAAGYQEYVKELPAAVAANALALQLASGEARTAIIATINDRVADRVRSAIENGLTAFQKVRVFLGTLNLDDVVNSTFHAFPENFFRLPPDSAFVLPLKAGESDAYEIKGNLQVQVVQVDRCQDELNAVKAAKSEVDNIENTIQELKKQAAKASPSEREIINADIKRLREEELPLAQEALEGARRALQACQN